MSDLSNAGPIENLPANKLGGELAIQPVGAGGMLIPATMRDVVEFSQLMAKADLAVRKHFRGNPGICLAVTMQALRWGMDPFAVGNKTYVVNDQLAYEAQLIAAVINMRAPVIERPRIRFEGEGPTRKAIVWATLVGESEPREIETPRNQDIKIKNSPLWTSDLDQQLSYYGLRSWARRWCPEIILGVYDPEELAEAQRAERARDVTPAAGPVPKDKPKRSDYKAPAAKSEAKDPPAEQTAPAAEQKAGGTPAHDPETGEILEDKSAEDDGGAEPFDADAWADDYIGNLEACETPDDIMQLAQGNQDRLAALPPPASNRVADAVRKHRERVLKATRS